MDVVGSEIGQKMRSAIKAKLTELGCYVDDELPDYVMVMVANKRTRAQMEEDLQLFLGDNTELFVNWLHQVLKKLQEVTVPPLQPEPEKTKEKTKEKKPKEKKDKDKVKLKKIDTVKKAKKKEKAKEKLRKKEEKKSHKSKKKSKHHEMIRPNIPPLLMNIEKESEPSITDVFAGQILKNHGIILDMPKEDKAVDTKPVLPEPKRPILPIIDPATISSQPEPEPNTQDNRPNVTMGAPREEQIKEINEIEAKIQGLKQKLAEQLDSMSDDEDFLNIRTEAEELMNDFAEDVFQEISSQAPPVAPSVETPPIRLKSPSPPPSPKISVPEKVPEETPIEVIVETPKEPELPQIELKLPKRPIRERLGIRDEPKKLLEESQKKFPEGPIKLVPETSKAGKDKQDKRTESPERYTPDRDPFWGKLRPAKSRLRDHPDTSSKKRSKSDSDESEKSDEGFRKGSSNPKRGGCVSVVCVRPRPRAPAPASALLLRAVADAHKSLLNIPPKMDAEQQKVKRALVLPIRRSMEQKIVIQVPGDRQSDSEIRLDLDSDEEKLLKMDSDKEEYIPTSITKKITNTDYVPSRRPERTTSRRDDTLIVETINIHNTTVDKDKDTQFIVTMDGFNPNAFLAKKLKTEGLLDDESEVLPKEAKTTPITTKSVLKTHETEKPIETKTAEKSIETKTPEKKDERPESVKKSDTVIEAIEKKVIEEENIVEPPTTPSQKKRLSDTSDDSDIHVIIKADGAEKVDKRKSDEIPRNKIVEECATAKKRKASPIVFDVAKKEKEGEIKRERTKSESSDNHVVVTTNSSHKYDSLPSLPSERKQVWCRSFPSCRWGAMCAFAHPRCKFAAACTRRGCVYQHDRPPATPVPVPVPHAVVPSTAPIIASHVVPAANYKSISGAIPSVCKYYPNCVNPACHYYHPKPCRYGKACANKLECNFYHTDVPSKWRYPV